jgi:hypothetical protein
MHGESGFTERNEAGEKVLDFATSYELTIIDTCLYKIIC